MIGKCNNAFHSSIKIKPLDVKSDTYINFSVESNIKKPKSKVDDYMQMSKCKSIFAKGYT